jgi:hypothetical protein
VLYRGSQSLEIQRSLRRYGSNPRSTEAFGGGCRSLHLHEKSKSASDTTSYNSSTPHSRHIRSLIPPRRCSDTLPHTRAMSRNPLPEKVAVAAPSFPAFIPSIIATAILSLALGYWVGVGRSLLPSSRLRRRGQSSSGKHADSSSSEASSDDEIDSAHAISEALQDSSEECKMASLLAYRYCC